MSDRALLRAVPAVPSPLEHPGTVPDLQTRSGPSAAQSRALPASAAPTACRVTRTLPAPLQRSDIISGRGYALPCDYVNDASAIDALHSQWLAACESPLGLHPLSKAYVRYRDHMAALHVHNPQRYARVFSQLHPEGNPPPGIPVPVTGPAGPAVER